LGHLSVEEEELSVEEQRAASSELSEQRAASSRSELTISSARGVHSKLVEV
jgi:hypothetical protein